MTRRALAPPLAALVLAGCGYALVGRSSTLPEDVRSIYVRPLQNLTTRAQVDQILTRALTEEFVTRQRFKVVSDSSQADAILSGAVLDFRARPVAFDTSARARQYEVLITARMEFKRRDGDEVLWKQDNYLFRDNYDADPESESFFDRENVAIEEVAEKFAETMVIDLLEGF